MYIEIFNIILTIEKCLDVIILYKYVQYTADYESDAIEL